MFCVVGVDNDDDYKDMVAEESESSRNENGRGAQCKERGDDEIMPMRYEEARTPTCGNKENADYDIIGNDGGHELVSERWTEQRVPFEV